MRMRSSLGQALTTALQGTDLADLPHLKPSEKLSFADVVANWARQVKAVAEPKQEAA
jgi:hypothetical protein